MRENALPARGFWPRFESLQPARPRPRSGGHEACAYLFKHLERAARAPPVVGGDAHPTRGKVFRVMVGPFLSRAEAVAGGAELKKETGIDGFARAL